MTQRKVATYSGGVFLKTQKILACMACYPQGATPKMIALDSSINVNTVKSLLPKIPGIKKTMRGLYLVVNGGDAPPPPLKNELTSWTFHNCHLSCQISENTPNPINTTESLGLINLKFELSSKGHATLVTACDTPLNLSSISILYAYFREVTKPYCSRVITERDVIIRTIEFNRDYTNLRLDGLNCISFDNLLTQFKIYQKKLCLRVEHKTKVPISTESVLDMLTCNPSTLDMTSKLTAQKDQIDRLSLAVGTTNQLILKLLASTKPTHEQVKVIE